MGDDMADLIEKFHDEFAQAAYGTAAHLSILVADRFRREGALGSAALWVGYGQVAAALLPVASGLDD
jgi:hypothetical protein